MMSRFLCLAQMSSPISDISFVVRCSSAGALIHRCLLLHKASGPKCCLVPAASHIRHQQASLLPVQEANFFLGKRQFFSFSVSTEKMVEMHNLHTNILHGNSSYLTWALSQKLSATWAFGTRCTDSMWQSPH